MNFNISPKCYKSICSFVLFFITISTYAQVGINTTTPAEGALLDVTSTDKGVMIPKVDIADLATIDPVTGVTPTVPGLAAVEGMLVYNTNAITGPGYFYWTGTEWASVAGTPEPPIDSVSLAADYSKGAGPFSDVPGMSLTFVARKTSVLVTLSGSGDTSATVGSGIGDFLVYNDTAGAVFGGTHSQLTSWSDSFGVVAAGWSLSFSKLLTGLTIGNTYTLRVQALADPILVFTGVPPELQIFPVTLPNDHHLTLTVMQ